MQNRGNADEARKNVVAVRRQSYDAMPSERGRWSMVDTAADLPVYELFKEIDTLLIEMKAVPPDRRLEFEGRFKALMQRHGEMFDERCRALYHRACALSASG